MSGRESTLVVMDLVSYVCVCVSAIKPVKREPTAALTPLASLGVTWPSI